MAQIFTNNANSKLVAGISNVSLSLQIAAGDGMKFPSPTGGDFFLVTLSKIASGVETSVEIVKVTARATDVFTIVRAQESTTALTYAEGDSVSLRATAGLLTSTETHKNNVANPHSVTKAQVGLGSVDNTADTAKPVSTVQQTALNLKADLASPVFTGNVTGLGVATGTSFNAITGLASTTPAATGVAAVGVSTTAARSDHVHLAPVNITGNAATVTTNANLTGEVTSAGNATTVTNAAVIGKVLTGYVSGAGTVAATDTILQAVNKLNGNVALKGVGDVTLAGVQSLTNKTITDIVFALTGTTPAFTATNGGVQTWTLSGASTPTNSLTTGQSIILVITPGANTITWPSVTWTKQGGSGAAPTLFSAGKTSVVLWMVGSTLYGSHLGDNS